MSAQFCKKYTILDKSRTITREVKKETRQMTPFFSSTFSALTVIDIHFLYLKIVQIHIHGVRPLVHSGL